MELKEIKGIFLIIMIIGIQLLTLRVIFSTKNRGKSKIFHVVNFKLKKKRKKGMKN
jgi:hypothetical protein